MELRGHGDWILFMTFDRLRRPLSLTFVTGVINKLRKLEALIMFHAIPETSIRSKHPVSYNVTYGRHSHQLSGSNGSPHSFPYSLPLLLIFLCFILPIPVLLLLPRLYCSQCIIYYYHLLMLGNRINHCIDRLPEEQVLNATSLLCTIKPANDHFVSTSEDSFSAGLDTTLDDFSSFNVFCFSTTTGSKSLETRLIGIGYEFSLGHVNIRSIHPFVTHNF